MDMGVGRTVGDKMNSGYFFFIQTLKGVGDRETWSNPQSAGKIPSIRLLTFGKCLMDE